MKSIRDRTQCCRSNAFLRTDWAIMEAMIRLLDTKSFEEIIIQDLLEETPVTRATFYAHFHDKYEVAERMQQMFFEQIRTTREEMNLVNDRNYARIIQKSAARYQALYQALLKIHTSKVDLQRIMGLMHRQQYLDRYADQADPYCQAQADIYAQLMASFYLAYLEHMDDALKDNDYFDHLIVPVFLAAINQIDNQVLKEQILSHLPGNTTKNN